MKKILNINLNCYTDEAPKLRSNKFTVGFKELYYYDIGKLNISELSNLSEEEIRLNYDYLIDYNLSKDEVDFEMPTIKSSPQGKIHFEEVRDIFQNLNKLFNLCFVVSIIGLFINIKNKQIDFLNTTWKALISIPMLLALPIIINFEDSFVIFHELMFSNDYWIFDPRIDPVINMLPEQFFFHAGLMMIVITLLSSMVIYSIYRLLRKKREQ